MRLLNLILLILFRSERLGHPALCHFYAFSRNGKRLHHANEYVGCYRWVSTLHNRRGLIRLISIFWICQLPWWTTPPSITKQRYLTTNVPTQTTAITPSISRTASLSGLRASKVGSCRLSSTATCWRRFVDIESVLRHAEEPACRCVASKG